MIDMLCDFERRDSELNCNIAFNFSAPVTVIEHLLRFSEDSETVVVQPVGRRVDRGEAGRIVYCCERGVHFTLAYRRYEWKKAVVADPSAIAAKLEELTDRGGVGLTPHAAAIIEPSQLSQP
jgi:hypothetical protein